MLFEFDKDFNTKIIGTDEAGRGPGAGGVFAAAVYFPNINQDLKEKLVQLNDSKKLSPKTREKLFDIIIQNSIYSIKMIDIDEIEKINILNSSLKAMKIAVENVMSQINEECLVIVDGNRKIKNFEKVQKTIVKGDGKSASIAAASILAKVSRDRYMQDLDKKFPQYNWKQNAGYLTKEHIEAIKKNGITKYHRKSFLKKILAPKQLTIN